MQLHTSFMKEAVEIFNYLENKTGETKQHRDIMYIVNRLKDGATKEQCFKAIDRRYVAWGKNPEQRKNLQPHIIFSKNNFKGYSH